MGLDPGGGGGGGAGSLYLLLKPTHQKTKNLQICENQAVDHFCSSGIADKRRSFRYTDSTIPLLLKSEISSCDYTGRSVSDLVGTTPNCWFSHSAAHFDELLTIHT